MRALIPMWKEMSNNDKTAESSMGMACSKGRGEREEVTCVFKLVLARCPPSTLYRGREKTFMPSILIP